MALAIELEFEQCIGVRVWNVVFGMLCTGIELT